MSGRRRRPRVPGTRRRVLALVPRPREGASEAVRLALELREAASRNGRCVCGAQAEAFEVGEDGELRPVRVPGAAGIYLIRLAHREDCPAVSPELDRALARGEIDDPAGDLLPRLAEGA